MNAQNQSIRFLTFIVAGITAGLVICNTHFFSRFSSHAGGDPSSSAVVRHVEDFLADSADLVEKNSSEKVENGLWEEIEKKIDEKLAGQKTEFLQAERLERFTERESFSPPRTDVSQNEIPQNEPPIYFQNESPPSPYPAASALSVTLPEDLPETVSPKSAGKEELSVLDLPGLDFEPESQSAGMSAVSASPSIQMGSDSDAVINYSSPNSSEDGIFPLAESESANFADSPSSPNLPTELPDFVPPSAERPEENPSRYTPVAETREAAKESSPMTLDTLFQDIKREEIVQSNSSPRDMYSTAPSSAQEVDVWGGVENPLRPRRRTETRRVEPVSTQMVSKPYSPPAPAAPSISAQNTVSPYPQVASVSPNEIPPPVDYVQDAATSPATWNKTEMAPFAPSEEVSQTSLPPYLPEASPKTPGTLPETSPGTVVGSLPPEMAVESRYPQGRNLDLPQDFSTTRHVALPVTENRPVAEAAVRNPGMAQPPKNTGAFTTREEIVIQNSRTDIRRLIRMVERHADLQVYASFEVQGEVACDIRSQDVDEVLQKLLGATSFGYVREEGRVYIGRRNDVLNLPARVSELGARRVTPQHISIDLCERFIAAHLTSRGEYERMNRGGTEYLIVRDMELALLEMDQALALMDIPPVKKKLDTFVFERGSQNDKLLDLTAFAEKADVVLQKYGEAVTEKKKDEEEKAKEEKEEKKGFSDFFLKKDPPSKKSEIDKNTKFRIYTLSHNIDKLLMKLEDEKGIKLISDRKGSSFDYAGNKKFIYPFTLKYREEEADHTVTIQTPPDPAKTMNLGELLNELPPPILSIECKKNAKKNVPADSIQFIAPLERNSALVFQGKVGSFDDKSNLVKNVSNAKRYTEIITVIVLREDEMQVPRTVFSNIALRYLAVRCEQLGMETIDREGESPVTIQAAKDFIMMAKQLRLIRNSL